MSTHNIGFYEDLTKITFELSSNTHLISSAADRKLLFINIIMIFFFLIQFNVPFKIISLIETSQSIVGVKREYPGKTT